MFHGNTFYVKRDDLIDPFLSGNKYRKLYALTQITPADIDTVISYGGNQSNAMYSIAALCHQQGWKFEYITKTIPGYLRDKLTGNLKNALAFGMQLHEVSAKEYEEQVAKLKEKYPLKPKIDHSKMAKGNPRGGKKILIRQGGADPVAEAGIFKLAAEILVWSESIQLRRLNIITPSGTGTTAFYLAKSLPQFQVYTTALVGTDDYLREQMSQLGKIPDNLHMMETRKSYRFGHLYQEYLEIQQGLHQSGIQFDLLYAPKTWLALGENLEKLDGEILYVHSGGISGNETMLERYKYAGLFGK